MKLILYQGDTEADSLTLFIRSSSQAVSCLRSSNMKQLNTEKLRINFARHTYAIVVITRVFKY